MAKKLFRSLMMGVIVFAVAVLAGYLSYVITYRYQTERVKAKLHPEDAVAASSVYSQTQSLSDDTIPAEFYIARLENENIAIYVSHKGNEAFLYSLDIHIGDLTETDVLQLTQGIVLKTRKDLASFEEDFTS